MSNHDDIKIEKGKKVRKMSKKKWILSSIILFGALLSAALILTFSLKKSPNSPGNNGTTTKLTDVSDASDFTYIKRTNNAKYSISSSEYAVITGLSSTGISKIQMNQGSSYRLVFPSVVLELNSFTGNYDDIPVCEINTMDFTTDSTGETPYRPLQGPQFNLSFFSYAKTNYGKNAVTNVDSTTNVTDGATYPDWISEVVVPESVQYIATGSFHGLDHLEKITLPFVGTERGNSAIGSGVAATDGYKSAFGAIFGYNDTIKGNPVPNNNYFPITDARHPSFTDANGQILDINKQLGATGSNSNYINSCFYSWYNDEVDLSVNAFTKLNMPYNLREIVITDEISLANHAFFNLFDVKNIDVSFKNTSSSLTDAGIIGEYAFAKCVNLETVKLPDSLSEMGGVSAIKIGTFNECYKLKTVTLPSNLKEISDSMFYRCNGLESLMIPKTVEKIGAQAFDECDSLSSIYPSNGTAEAETLRLPETVKEIGKQAFRACKSFKTIVIPNQTRTIGQYAFDSCINIVSMTLPFIGKEAGNSGSDEALFGWIFGRTTDSTSTSTGAVSVKQNITGSQNDSNQSNIFTYYIPQKLESLLILNETVVAPGALMNLSNLKTLAIQYPAQSEQAMTFAKGALSGCSKLKTLTLPFLGEHDYTDTLGRPTYAQLGWAFGTETYNGSYGVSAALNTGDSAFDWQVPTSLTSVHLEHQTVLPSYGFCNNTNITEIVIGKNTVSSESAVFYNTVALAKLEVPFVGYQRGSKCTTGFWWGPSATYYRSLSFFFGASALNGYYPNTYNYYYQIAIPDALKEVTVTDDTYFYTSSFAGFESLEKISLQTGDNDITGIEGSLFYNCHSLKTLEIPFIGAGRNVERLNSVSYTMHYMFGESEYEGTYYVKNIFNNNRSYYFPKSLESITIGDGINCIPAYAFSGMMNVNSITTNAQIDTISVSAFEGCYNLAILKMDNAKYVDVADRAFMYCYSLGETNKFLPSTVRTIGNYALAGTSITGIDSRLKNKITSLGVGALASCQNITSFDFNEYSNLKSVGSYLFSGCKNLTNVTLTKFLTAYMFQNCISLENMDLSTVLGRLEGVDSTHGATIPEGLFDGCTSLKSPVANSTSVGVYFDTGDNIECIGAYAFRGCVSLTNLDLPIRLQEIREGAFQNCIKLEMLRIPRDCYIMPEGTNKTTNEDHLDTGIFYGCNPDFYLEVYPDESDWPSTWGYNWNCYFPVHVIGGSSADIYTYEYDNNLKGYIITGLNFDKYTFVDRTTGNIKYLLSDTVTFPSTYMGLPVYGIADGAFSGTDQDPKGHNAQDAFSKVNKFILGTDFKTLGASALTFNDIDESTGDDKGYQRPVYIFSQRTLANSQSFAGLHVDQENVYSAKAMIFYRDVWKFVGTRPVILLDALTFNLENDSYQYAMGEHIIPVIDSITAQPIDSSNGTNAIKYTNQDIINLTGDYIYDIFYEADGSLNLSNLNVQYANNVNAGTASIIIDSNTPDVYGRKIIYFTINPIELDLFTESDKSNSLFNDYGIGADSAPVVFEWLYNVYYSINNKITEDDIKNDQFLTTFFKKYSNMTYGATWEFSNWVVGSAALNLPENYKMTGVLTTSSNNRGIYMSWKDSTAGKSVSDLDSSIGGFVWKTSPHVYDENGKDVTSNFTFMITNCVVINPYELTSDGVNWDGNLNGDIWEYPYTGEAVIPKPSIKNSSINLAAECTVEVRDPGTTNATTAIDPFTINGKTYWAVITQTSNNFELGNSTVQMEFKIVPSNVYININIKHTILETEDFYRFSGPYITAKGDNYDISITGLGNSTITGDLETSGYQKGTYRNGETLNFDFGIQGGSLFKITSNVRLGVGTSNLDETKDGVYYIVHYDMQCQILWQEFDARLELTDRDGQGNDVVYEANNQNVFPNYSLVESSLEENEALVNGKKVELTYGTDGYEHPLTVNVLNSRATNLGTFVDLSNNSAASMGKYIIKETGTYNVELTLEKEKYETMVLRITIYVEKGNYIFNNLSKEYDREPVDVFDAFARKPYDFNESKIQYQFYNSATNEAINPPTNIGNYYVIITTDKDHSDYFNDLPNAKVNNKISFTITPRNIIIDVEDPINEKVYDGFPWSYSAVNDTKTSLNLLPGDALTGEFQSRSNKVGTYDGSVKGDFFNVAGFTVINSSFAQNEQNQTSNYQIKYKGTFTIKPKTMKYSSSGGEYDYDGRHHTITVTVSEPTDNYTIYYALERVIDSEGNDMTEWTPYPYYFAEPNSGNETYLVYFKIEAETYETVYGMEQIRIKGRTVKYQQGTVDFTYDGFYHTPEIIPVDPKYATVKYAVLTDPSNVNFDELEWTTVPMSYKDVGSYYYAFKVEATNYTSDQGIFTMTITDNGPSLSGLFNLEGEIVDYDTLYHGIILNNLSSTINLSNLYFSYAINDLSYDKDTSTFTNISFTADATTAGQYYNKSYRNAGTYDLVIRVLAKGYKPYYQAITVQINPLKLYLTSTFYHNYYDGDYHTVLLSLSSTAPSTDKLTVTGTLADGDLTYEYQTIINGEVHYIPLTVRYGVLYANNAPAGATPAMSADILKYKDVCNYLMFVEAEAENFELYEASGAFEIMQNNLYVEVNEPVEIQYLARSVESNDFLERTEVNAATGKEETIYSIQSYFDATKQKLVTHDGELLMKFQEYSKQNNQWVLNPSFINNPINIGHYKAYYRFTGTPNCSATEWAEFDFDIVPRVLKVEYEDELEYNGNPQIPSPVISTGTSDNVDYITSMVDPTYVPTIPGDYKFMLVERTVNQNYRLATIHAGDLDYKIINRKVYVDYDDEEEYTAYYVTISTEYQGSNYLSGSTKFKVSNLLAYDTIDISLTSESFYRATYMFKDAIFQYDNISSSYVKTSDMTDPRYYQFNPATVSIKDQKNNDVIYYDIIFNVNMVIKRPNLEVEYDDVQTVTFDGLQHGVDFKVTSPGYTSGTFTYWIDGEKDSTSSNTMITRRNVGTYDICFKIQTYDYEDYEGKITLIINRATLNVNLDPYSSVYDGTDQTTTYQILNNPMQLLKIEEPELFYIRKEYVENLGCTKADLTKFFQDNTPENNTLYGLYVTRENVMHNAGDYYAILYYPQYAQNVAANIEGVLAIEECRIEYRTLWFKTTLNNPIIKWKTYDTLKYGEGNLLLTLADFIYDTNPSCPNFLGNNGLVTGDSIVGGNTNLGNYLIQTSSANARGNADGENNGDPYQFEGDFEFRYIEIVNQLGQQMASNYRPAFEEMNYNGADVYPLQITIKRAQLTVFEVSNAVKEYTGAGLYPNIITPTDGLLDAFYYETNANYDDPATTGNPRKSGAPVDVGYYIVYVHANQGTNYYEWKYPSNPQVNDYLDTDGTAYRFARLQITPRNVEVDWGSEWTENNYTITFDGKTHTANPKIELASGALQSLTFKVLDVKTNETQVQSVINAGYYYFKALPIGTNFNGEKNYNLINDTVLITILKRSITVYEETNEPWLKSKWYKDYTEDDFETWPKSTPQDPTPDLYNYSLSLHIETISDESGTYKNADDFKVTAIVTDKNVIPSATYYEGVDPSYVNDPRKVNVFAGETFDVSNNFEFNLNMLITLDNKDLRVDKSDVDVIYQNADIYPNLKITSYNRGYTVRYAVSYIEENQVTGNLSYYQYDMTTGEIVRDSQNLPKTFDEAAINYNLVSMPSFRNVGYYKVYYMVAVPGDDGVTNSYTGTTTVRIRQRDSYISINKLDKIYDGVGIFSGDISVTGGYNGDKSNLEFWFMEEGGTAYSPNFRPLHAGTYLLKIVNKADNNDDYHQNYTPIDQTGNEFRFTISPATLTLTVEDDITITSDPVNLTYSSNVANISTKSNGSGTSSMGVLKSLYTPTIGSNIGLFGNDTLSVTIMTLPGQFLNRGKYNYTNGTAFVSDNENFYNTPSIFNITWDTYYNTNSSNTKSHDYELKLIYSLNVHYPYIEGNAVDVTTDYTGQSISLMGLNPLTVTYPLASANVTLTYNFGETPKSLIYTGDYEKTSPGKYIVYFSVEAPYYEAWTGSITFTIKALSRDGLLTDVALDKEYDAIAYDGKTTGVPNIEWIDPNNEQSNPLPAKSTWLVQYFKARSATSRASSTGGWVKDSDALTSVVNADDYIYRVTIPASGIYGETIIEKYFKISRKRYEIESQDVTIKYNGGTWVCDLFDGTHSFTTSGLNTGHTLQKATIISSSGNVGEYKQQNGNLDISADYKYVISDTFGKDVTNNYEYIINFKLTIERGDITLRSSIPSSGQYVYTGSKISPVVYSIEPSTLPDGCYVEYSLDGQNWSSDPTTIGQTNVGKYTFQARLLNVPNYNDKTETFEYEIVKQQRTINISDLSKEYDGSACDWPTIVTQGFTGTVSDNNTRNIKIEWYAEDKITKLASRPVNAGKYNVKIIYPSEGDYAGTEVMKEFEITPCVLTLNVPEQTLTYNAKEQAPDIKIYRKSNNKFDVDKLLAGKYSVTYYLQSDIYHTNGTQAKYKNVGDYQVGYELTDPDAINNFIFDLTQNEKIYVDYKITKAIVNISYSGTLAYTGNKITINSSDLSVSGLPAGTSLASSINLKNFASGIYQAKGLYDCKDFIDNFEWSTTNSLGINKPVITYNNADEDIDANYTITVDLDITVSGDALPYTVTPYDGVYDGMQHTFSFKVNNSDSTTVIEYSTDGKTYSTSIPYYTEVTKTPQHIYVKVTCKTYNDGNPVYLGTDPNDANYNRFTVNITKAKTTIDYANVDISDKVYDDEDIVLPTVTLSPQYNPNEDITDYLQYRFYQQDYSSSGSIYKLVDRVDVRNVGSYYLDIKLVGAPNYEDTTDSELVHLYFKITPRKVVISLKNVSKVYDSVPWQTRVSNLPSLNDGAQIHGVSGITESGLVANHQLTGVVQTIKANAGRYSLSSDFVWENGVEITKSENGKTTHINLDNYDIIFDFDVLIAKAQFDITFEDVHGTYDGKTLYYISHKWNTYPLVSLPTGANALDYYESMIEYNDISFASTTWQQSPIGRLVGTTTIYVKVHDPDGNYEDYLTTAQIIVAPLDASFNIGDLGVLAADKTYNGDPYEESTIKVTSSIPNDTRTVKFKYYERLADGSRGTALQGPPTNAGNYILTMYLDADPTNGLAAVEQDSPFNVIPAKIPVYWGANYVDTTTNPNKYIYKMNYTGSVVHPEAQAYGVVNVGAGTPNDPWYELIPLDVTVMAGYDGTNKGKHLCEATIHQDNTNLFYKNYELINPQLEYEITDGLPTNPGNNNGIYFPPGPDNGNGSGPNPNPGSNGTGGNAQTPGTKPSENTNSMFMGIEFRVDQYNPLAAQANTPFKYLDDEIVIEVIYHYSDPNDDKTYILHLDQKTWKIIEIRDDTNNNIIDSNPQLNFELQFPDPLVTPTFNVTAHLTDSNSAWDTNGNKQDQNITVHLEPKTLDPNNPGGANYIWLETPLNNSLLASTASPKVPVEYAGNDPLKPNEYIRVWQDVNATPNDPTDDLEILLSNYTIYYGNNTNPTPTNAINPDDYAYFIVKSNQGGLYSFEFGDYTLYENEINAHSTDPTWINENAAPNVAQNAAFTFVIVSPEPTVIELVDDGNNANGVKFVQYQQSFSNGSTSSLTYTYGISNGDRETGLSSITSLTARMESTYKLSHIPEKQNLNYVLSNVKNKREFLALYAEDGTLLWDGAGIQTGTLNPSSTDKLDYIGSGMFLVLYDTDTASRKPIDGVQLIVVGDTNGDGMIGAADASEIVSNSLNSFDATNTSQYQTAKYLAGLLSDLSIQGAADASTVILHSLELNYDYIEDNFYKRFIGV